MKVDFLSSQGGVSFSPPGIGGASYYKKIMMLIPDGKYNATTILHKIGARHRFWQTKEPKSSDCCPRISIIRYNFPSRDTRSFT
jgi:hypothetical protein